MVNLLPIHHLLDQDPEVMDTFYWKHSTAGPFILRLVEHPIHGDSYPIIAICGDKAWSTDFFDPWDDKGDMEIIKEQFEQVMA